MRAHNQISIARYNIFNIVAVAFLILTFAIKAFTDGPYVRGEISSTVAYSKYITAAISCFAAFLIMLRNGEHHFVAEFNKLMLMVLVFAFISLVQQAYSGIVSFTTYGELIKLAMPMVLAYCILNALSYKELNRCMLAILVISFCGYLVDLHDKGASILSIFQSDFSASQSETESSGFAEIALMLSLYFAYFRTSKVALVWSTIFSILTFKRLALVVVLVAFIISVFFPRLVHTRISRRFIVALKIGTLVAVLFWYWLLLPEQEPLFVNLFGDVPAAFTMGRSDVMRYLISSDFESFGFGSANAVVNAQFGVPFEMDLIKIAIELTPLALVLFVWVFWDLTSGSFWGMFIVGYYMLNMITSDSLTSNFSFTLAYIVLGLVGIKESEQNVPCEEYGELEGSARHVD